VGKHCAPLPSDPHRHSLTSSPCSAIQYLQLQGIVPNLQNPDLIDALDTQRTHLWQKPPSNSRKKASLTKNQVIDPLTGARQFDTTFAKISDAKDKEAFFAAANQAQPPTRPLQAISKGPLFVQMGQILKGFFDWISRFDFTECGISIRLGTPFRRFDKVCKKEFLHLPYVAAAPTGWKDDSAVVVQDPFILDRNTANVVEKTKERIGDECWRAIALLEEERESDGALLFDLLLSVEHEEMILQHERAMHAFDEATQDRILQQTGER
jgi:hypothetical protein